MKLYLKIFIQNNALQNVVCKMADILSGLNVLMSQICKIYTFKWSELMSFVCHLPPLKKKKK